MNLIHSVFHLAVQMRYAVVILHTIAEGKESVSVLRSAYSKSSSMTPLFAIK